MKIIYFQRMAAVFLILLVLTSKAYSQYNGAYKSGMLSFFSSNATIPSGCSLSEDEKFNLVKSVSSCLTYTTGSAYVFTAKNSGCNSVYASASSALQAAVTADCSKKAAATATKSGTASRSYGTGAKTAAITQVATAVNASGGTTGNSSGSSGGSGDNATGAPATQAATIQASSGNTTPTSRVAIPTDSSTTSTTATPDGASTVKDVANEWGQSTTSVQKTMNADTKAAAATSEITEAQQSLPGANLQEAAQSASSDSFDWNEIIFGDSEIQATKKAAQLLKAKILNNITLDTSSLQKKFTELVPTFTRELTFAQSQSTTGSAYNGKIASVGETSIKQIHLNMNELRTKIDNYNFNKETCIEDSVKADKLCSLTRGPKATTIQTLMTLGLAAVSKTKAASESCKLTTNLNLLAQTGMLVGQGWCTYNKNKCESSCEIVRKNLEDIGINIKSISVEVAKIRNILSNDENFTGTNSILTTTHAHLASLSNALTEDLKAEVKGTTVSSIKACNGYSVNLMTMGMQIAGFLSAKNDAKTCQNKLSSKSTTTTGTIYSSLSTEEFCSDSSNSTNMVCICNSDPSSVNCAGSAAYTSAKAATTKNANGTSGFAMDAKDKAINSNAGNSSSTNLTDEDKKSLGFSSGENFNNNGGSVAASAASEGGAGVGARSSEKNNAEDIKKDSNKKSLLSNFSFSSLSGSLSRLFGGSNSKVGNSQNGKTFSAAEYEQKLKRKLASEQLRTEVSTASGDSNFAKIRNRYQSTSTSLFEGE